MSVLETAREHPLAAGTIGIAAIVILYLLFRGGGSKATVDGAGYGYDVGAATDAQTAALQAQQAGASISAQVQANQDNNAAAVTIAGLQAALGSKTVDASQTVALATINANQQYYSLHDSLIAQTSQLGTTLQAQTEQAAIVNETQRAQIAASTTIETTRAVAEALTTQAGYNADVAKSYIGAQSATNLAAIQASQKSCGLFGKIFGC